MRRRLILYVILFLTGCTHQKTDPRPDTVLPDDPPFLSESLILSPKSVIINGYTIGDRINPSDFQPVSVISDPIPLEELRHNRCSGLFVRVLPEDIIYEIIRKRIPKSEIAALKDEIVSQLDAQPEYKPLPASAPSWAFESYTWQVDQIEIQLLHACYLGNDRYRKRFMDRSWTLYYRDHGLQRQLENRYRDLP